MEKPSGISETIIPLQATAQSPLHLQPHSQEVFVALPVFLAEPTCWAWSIPAIGVSLAIALIAIIAAWS